MSLEDLLQVEVTVAATIKEDARQAPAILTVITRADIARNHCRDLIDVFNMIAGFSISTDVFETGALNVRGLYGLEGRALVMVDGMPMNENLFGSYVLGNGFPIHLVERIEVIRGPGSVIYGGAAELAVINIVTMPMDADRPNQRYLATRWGMLSTGVTGHRDVGFSVRRRTGDWALGLYGFAGAGVKGVRSDRLDELGQDPTFPTYELTEGSYGTGNVALGAQAAYDQRLFAKAVYQRYINGFRETYFNTDLDAWEGNGVDKRVMFEVANANLSGAFPAGAYAEIRPGLGLHYDRAWWNQYPANRSDITNFPTLRVRPHVLAELTIARLRGVVGAEVFWDHAWVGGSGTNPLTGEAIRPYAKPDDAAPSDSVTLWNYAAYASARYTLRRGLQLLGGLRVDRNELTGTGVSPRAGVSLVVDRLHAKLLYSEAFRAPHIANSVHNEYSLNVENATGERFDIRREKTRVLELEAGYVLPVGLTVTGNVFAQVVDDIIQYDPEFDYFTKNGGKQGSSGVELELKMRRGRYRSMANLSYVEPGLRWLDDEKYLEGTTYLTPGRDPAFFLGVPKIKAYTSHTYEMTDSLTLSANGLIYGRRYQHRYDADFNERPRKLTPSLVLGAGLRFRDVAAPGVNVDVFVHDLLDEQIEYVSSFDSLLYNTHPFSAVHHKGRELSVNLSYAH